MSPQVSNRRRWLYQSTLDSALPRQDRHLSGGRRRLGTCRFGFGAAAMMIAAFDSGGVRQGALRGAEGACGFVPASSDGLSARAGVAQASQAHWPGELDDLLEGDKRPGALARGPGHDGQDIQLELPATADPGVPAGA